MAYTRDWDETVPDDNQYGSTTGPWFRKTKIDIAERLKNWIYGFISGETQEGLKKAPLVAQSSAPGAESGKGIIYAKEVSGVVELFFKDSNGNEVQLTTGGSVNGWQFRSGDLLFSSNTTAPPGWTDVSTTYENKFIRISSGTPLQTGGSDTHDHGGSTGGHALTIDEIPPHTHTYYKYGSWGPEAPHSGSDWQGYETQNTGSTGGGQPHSHPIASAENIPAYVQVRVYKKD